jgi:hypothetical protein
MRKIIAVMALIASFSAFSEDWDAMGNPTPTTPTTQDDTSGDWDAMGNPR